MTRRSSESPERHHGSLEGSDPSIICDTSLSLCAAVNAALGRVRYRQVHLTLEPPKPEVTSTRLPAVSVYLHHVEETSDEGIPHLFRLHYLLSAWARTAKDEQTLLSVVLRALLKRPTLAGTDLVGRSFDAAATLPVIVSRRLDDGELSRFWSAMGQPPRPTIQCWTSVAMLRPEDDESEKAPPVRERELRFGRRFR